MLKTCKLLDPHSVCLIEQKVAYVETFSSYFVHAMRGDPVRPLPVEPRQKLSAIGNRLRDARKNRQMTIAQLAETTNLSKGFLSRVERDQTSPSVATLVNICDVLSVDIGDLFRESEARLVTASQAPAINLGGTKVSEVLLTPRTETRLQVVRSTVLPGDHATGGAELYTLNADVEVLHILSGDVEVLFSDISYSLHTGDTITLNGRDPHSWRTLTDTGAELLWVISPSSAAG